MIIYIAGPISNDPDYKEKFAAAEKDLTEVGHSVINPAFLPTDLGDCTDYMKICFPMINAAEAVAMLDGWEQSFGACREWGYAMAMDKIVVGIDAFDFDSGKCAHQECPDCESFIWCEAPKIHYYKTCAKACPDFKGKKQ